MNFMKHYQYPGRGYAGSKQNPITCDVLLFKKKVIVDGKKKIRKRFLPFKCFHGDKVDRVFLPTLGIKLKYNTKDPGGVLGVIGWAKRRLNFNGYEQYAMSAGWYHLGKPIYKDWLLPKLQS